MKWDSVKYPKDIKSCHALLKRLWELTDEQQVFISRYISHQPSTIKQQLESVHAKEIRSYS